MRILAIRGSLRAASINAAVLEAAALLAPAGLNIVQYSGLDELPIFNPDLDKDFPPDPVRRLREDVGLSDGLLIASPEYAHGVAGGLKSALDWLVGGPEFYQKPVAVLNASARGSRGRAFARNAGHHGGAVDRAGLDHLGPADGRRRRGRHRRRPASSRRACRGVATIRASDPRMRGARRLARKELASRDEKCE